MPIIRSPETIPVLLSHLVCNALVAGGRRSGVGQQAMLLETIVVLLPHMVCNALVAGGRRAGAGQQLCVRDEESCSTSIACCPAPDRRPPATKALHIICGNNTIIASSSWWWAQNCPKHVEQIIGAINHSVASSWFSSPRKNSCWRRRIRLL
jgi:hypothetical protein